MRVDVDAATLAATLAGRRVGGAARVALPVHTARWFGPDAASPVRRGPVDPASPPALCIHSRVQGATPTIDSPLDDAELGRRLDGWLARRLEVTLPGTLVQVDGVGVLLRGAAGCGKGETALALLQAGHRLVADDAVRLRAGRGDALHGVCPTLLRGRLAVRGLGLLDVRAHFGAAAWAPRSPVDLLVDLAPGSAAAGLGGDWGEAGLLGRRLTALRLAPGRPLASLVAAAACEWRQRRAGGNVAARFAAEQAAAVTGVRMVQE